MEQFIDTPPSSATSVDLCRSGRLLALGALHATCFLTEYAKDWLDGNKDGQALLDSFIGPNGQFSCLNKKSARSSPSTEVSVVGNSVNSSTVILPLQHVHDLAASALVLRPFTRNVYSRAVYSDLKVVGKMTPVLYCSTSLTCRRNCFAHFER